MVTDIFNPQRRNLLTESDIVNGVTRVYKEYKTLSKSLNSFRNMNGSIRQVVSTLFYMIYFIVFFFILGYNIYQVTCV